MTMNPTRETNLLKTTEFEIFRYVQFKQHDAFINKKAVFESVEIDVKVEM